MAHTEHEDFAWTLAIVGHTPRKETHPYAQSRALMHHIVDTLPDMLIAPGP
jgi:hypothetical protein